MRKQFCKLKESKKTIRHLIYFLLPVLFLVSSFNVSAKRVLTYADLVPLIKADSTLNICVATFDQREVVLQGNQNARFVGYIRTAVGIAYPIKCSSPENFSEVMSSTVVNSFKQNGCNASVLKTDYSNSKENVLDELKSQQADIFILITMNKWRTDTRPLSFTKVATELIYNLTVEIYSKTGELIATNNLDVHESGLAPAGATSTKKVQKKVINIKYPEVMTNLFADSEIEKSLQ